MAQRGRFGIAGCVNQCGRKIERLVGYVLSSQERGLRGPARKDLQVYEPERPRQAPSETLRPGSTIVRNREHDAARLQIGQFVMEPVVVDAQRIPLISRSGDSLIRRVHIDQVGGGTAAQNVTVIP